MIISDKLDHVTWNVSKEIKNIIDSPKINKRN